MVKICFTTCANDAFVEGMKGLIKSIRKFYDPSEADIIVFFEQQNDYIAAFCRSYSAELHYFGDIDCWRKPLLQANCFLGDITHYYHEDFQIIPDLPHHLDRAILDVDIAHHLHPLNVKAHCTAYCACVRQADLIVHIDSDAFLLSRIDELFIQHNQADTVIGFDDGKEDLKNMELLYKVAKPAGFDPNQYAINAGVVFYVNGPGLRQLLTEFSFYIDSCYHYTYSGSFADQGVLRALIAKHHILGKINFIRMDATNWNPTWFRADRLSFDSVRQQWINDANGREQHIWHGAGGEKLWTGRYSSQAVNRAWKWVGGTYEPGSYDSVKGSLIKQHCQLLCHAIDQHYSATGKKSLRILEIGTQYGRTAIAFCSILGSYGFECQIDTFDIYAPSLDYPTNYATLSESRENVNLFHLQEKIVLHSVDPCEDISVYLTSPVDIVFIDGDHRYKHVLADCLVAQRVAAADGLILGDDYQIESVRKAVWHAFGHERVVQLNASLWAVPLTPLPSQGSVTVSTRV